MTQKTNKINGGLHSARKPVQKDLFPAVRGVDAGPLVPVGKVRTPMQLLNDEWYKSYQEKYKRPTTEAFGTRLGIFKDLLNTFEHKYIEGVCKHYWSSDRWDWHARTVRNFRRYFDDIVFDMEKEMDRREEASGGGDPDGV